MNPRTGEEMTIKAKRVVKFKVGRLMRKRVSGDDEPDELEEQSPQTARPENDGLMQGESGAAGSA